MTELTRYSSTLPPFGAEPRPLSSFGGLLRDFVDRRLIAALDAGFCRVAAVRQSGLAATQKQTPRPIL